MVLGPRRVLRCRMTRKGATGCFGQEKASAAHLAQVNVTRRLCIESSYERHVKRSQLPWSQAI